MGLRTKIRALNNQGMSWSRLTAAFEAADPFLKKWERDLQRSKNENLIRLSAYLERFTDCSNEVQLFMLNHEIELKVESLFIFLGHLPEKRYIAFDLTLYDSTINTLARLVSKQFKTRARNVGLPCYAILQATTSTITRGTLVVPDQELGLTYPLSTKDWHNLLAEIST